jgi:hypothetical protein
MSARILAGPKKKRPDARRFPDDTRRARPNRWIEPTHGHIKGENDSWQKSHRLETTVRRTHPVTAGPARQCGGRRQLHHQASEIAALRAGVAGGNGMPNGRRKNGPTLMARIGIMRALNRHIERVFNPDWKDPHWGRRKLARDRRQLPPLRSGWTREGSSAAPPWRAKARRK